MWCRVENTGLGGEHCRDEQEEGGQSVHVVGVCEGMRTLSFIRKLAEVLPIFAGWFALGKDANEGDAANHSVRVCGVRSVHAISCTFSRSDHALSNYQMAPSSRHGIASSRHAHTIQVSVELILDSSPLP